MLPLNDATTHLLFAYLDRSGSGNFNGYNIYESTLCFSEEKVRI